MSLVSLMMIAGGGIVLIWLVILTVKISSLKRVDAELALSAKRLAQKIDDGGTRQKVLSKDFALLEQEHRGLRHEISKMRERPIYPAVSSEEGDFKLAQSPDPNRQGWNAEAPAAHPTLSDIERDVIRDFNALAADFSPSRRDDFIKDYSATNVTYENGRFVEYDKGQYWLIQPDWLETCLILPSGKVARDWEMHYRSMGGMMAKNELADVFELESGNSLKVTETAKADIIERSGLDL